MCAMRMNVNYLDLLPRASSLYFTNAPTAAKWLPRSEFRNMDSQSNSTVSRSILSNPFSGQRWITWYYTLRYIVYVYSVHIFPMNFSVNQKVELNTFSVPCSHYSGLPSTFIHVSISRCGWYPPKQREQDCVTKLWQVYLKGWIFY